MADIPLAAVERIMRNAGAERISQNAVTVLAEILGEIGIEISREAVELAKHAKRKTVKREDVKLATRRIVT